jgi:hypothetical protein
MDNTRRPSSGVNIIPKAGVENRQPSGSAIERVRYFPRQLITPDDLTREQEYFRAKMRRHNRLLHGWGVVCGCAVKPGTADWTVIVEPGCVLSPQGDEIVIDDAITIDLSRHGLDGNLASSSGDYQDIWCSNVRIDRRLPSTLYLAVAYAEFPSRPVRVQPAGCGCDDGQCEYSRIREGFVLRELQQLPSHYTSEAPKRDDAFHCDSDGLRPCPPSIADPWVVLAKIQLDEIQLNGRTISQTDITNTKHRHYVASFGNWWFECSGVQSAPVSTLRVDKIRVVMTGDSPAGPSKYELEIADIRTEAQVQLDTANAIDIHFTGASVDYGSVTSGTSFIVHYNQSGQPLPGKIQKMDDNWVRWIITKPELLPGGKYKVTLPENGIKSTEGHFLDGDLAGATGLPSGDGQAGGEFSFSFDFEDD